MPTLDAGWCLGLGKLWCTIKRQKRGELSWVDENIDVSSGRDAFGNIFDKLHCGSWCTWYDCAGTFARIFEGVLLSKTYRGLIARLDPIVRTPRWRGRQYSRNGENGGFNDKNGLLAHATGRADKAFRPVPGVRRRAKKSATQFTRPTTSFPLRHHSKCWGDCRRSGRVRGS